MHFFCFASSNAYYYALDITLNYIILLAGQVTVQQL